MEVTDKFTFNPKEGIDNPAMTEVAESEAVVTPTPRLCILKREESESFAFHLRVERGLLGHVVRQVTPWGVAERNGVKDGDRLLEVNESFLDDAKHTEVARKIHISGTQLCLLLLDGKAYDQAVAQGCDLKALARAQRGEDWDPPRLCHIARDSSQGLGLRILPIEGEKGKFSMSPSSGGPAEKAGVRKGDHLIWLDGATVSELSHSAISKMVKKCDHMTVLVIDSKSEQTYVSRRMPILPSMAVAHNLPHKPRKLHLVQAPEGYGFLLRLEKTPSKHNIHVLREVDPDSPAERAGIQEGEILLEVNEELITNLKHNDVVNRIRQSGQQVTLTIISLQGQDFFTRLGLSPLLFYEDTSAEPSESAELQQTADHCSDPQCAPAGEPPKPRVCVLSKGPSGYGFHLGCVLQKPGTYISQVVAEGPGGRAGLLKGDVVMEVNGTNVEEEYLEDVIVLIKEAGDSLSLLVVEPLGYEKLLQSRNVVIAEQTANGS
ncbi:PDZ domain containing 3b isoform X1 [Alosa sapidissima]|uniref:PDZ domain containing 3b isoform X1 n=1 Tax=Alosa sapidissima TaxID=34773 RepID=UPI001C0980F7|nr:PDZ domain containing 3b isoform X1 [Alosa sapidissima]